MNEYLLKVSEALKERFAAQEREHRGQMTAVLSAEQIVAATTMLRDEFAFDFLSSLTAVDYWPETEPRFHLVYQVWSNQHKVRLTLRVPLNDAAAEAPTVEAVYPVANWHEREIFDMFGVRFSGHSDMRRLLMPSDWVGHPLRKDYPLGYEEPQFTFNFEKIQARKHQGRYEEA